MNYREFRRNLLNVLTVVEEEMDRWSIDIACILPCTLTSMKTVYFQDIAWIASRQHLKRECIFVVCDILGVDAYTDVDLLSWYRSDDRVYKRTR